MGTARSHFRTKNVQKYICTKVLITQPFFELQTSDFAWKFIWNVEPNDKVQKYKTKKYKKMQKKMQKCKKHKKHKKYKNKKTLGRQKLVQKNRVKRKRPKNTKKSKNVKTQYKK